MCTAMRLQRLLVPGLLLLAVALPTARVGAQDDQDFGLDYGYGFYDDAYSYDFYDDLGFNPQGTDEYGSFYDEYGYYQDEDQAYYEYYGYYADDSGGYYADYYTEDMDSFDYITECRLSESNDPVLAEGIPTCDIKLSGVDKDAPQLKGGLDGVYKLSSCYNGKAMYKRKNSPAGEERVLWFSDTFGDWDVSRGDAPNEAEILMYGGEMEHAPAPLFVSAWHMAGQFREQSEDDFGADDYFPVSAKVSCADGTKYKPEDVLAMTTNKQQGPLLTPEELEKKYSNLYAQQYAKAADRRGQAQIGFMTVTMLVLVGLAMVMAIPYMLLRKRGPPGKGGMSITRGLAQLLGKGKASRHIN